MKVLGIGMPRTGTVSLATALTILRYSTKHYPVQIEDIAKYQACCEVRFSIADLNQKYPGSKFILTVRNEHDWLESCKRHSKFVQPDWNPFWFGDWSKRYQERLSEAQGLENLLIMDICAGDGWEKLCPFLEKDIPPVEFPHRNKSHVQ